MTVDIGLRGDMNDLVSLDITLFNLLYKDRIGFQQKKFKDGSVKSERGNIGDASIYGLESNIDFDINNMLFQR